MAHNFKLTGDYYVSVDGSDSNDGLTKDTPKRTVQAGLNLMGNSATSTLIIGAGVYRETLAKTYSVGGVPTLRADGYVILEGTGLNEIIFTNNSNGGLTTISLIGFEIRGYLSIRLSGGGAPSQSNVRVLNLTNCVIKNDVLGAVISNSSSSRINLTNCTLFYSVISVSGQLFVGISKCILFSCDSFGGNATSTFTNSYNNGGRTRVSSTFNYNNIQGNTVIIQAAASTVTSGVIQDTYGSYYDLSITTSTGSGTIGDPYGRPFTAGAGFYFAEHRIAYPTVNVNSFSLDPKFNDIEAQDFTLQADSPHLGRASDSTNIGGTSYAQRLAALGDVFNASAVSKVNVIQRGSDWVIDVDAPATEGTIVSAPKFVNNVPKVLQLIRYQGLYAFNKAVTPPSGQNVNVPDNFTYKSTTQPPDVAGGNPDRLVYELRFSTQVAQPAIDAEWDNDGLWTAGNYGVFEWNTKPSVDTGGIGNGDPTFVVADTPTFLQATWIQLRVKMINTYGT